MVAERQNYVRRFYLREQPVRTWVDRIAPWATMAKSKGTGKVNVDQCTTGLRDSHGVLIRKLARIMANHRLLFTPFELERCSGHRQHASACNKELSMAAQKTSKMQLLFVEAGQIAHDLFQATRDPFHGCPYSSTVLVTSARECDLDGP
eukprot:783363-Pyramimonas_sp.AAC.2